MAKTIVFYNEDRIIKKHRPAPDAGSQKYGEEQYG